MRFLFVLLALLIADPVHARVRVQCEARRAAAIEHLFREVRRVTGGDEITKDMMERYEDRIPRFQRWIVKGVLGKRGVNYILGRCRGEHGIITLESSLTRLDTCISTCTFARALEKFLDWGYAKYWG
jgi:hypothetical protein